MAVERFREFMDDTNILERVKVENFLLLKVGERPCSQVTVPFDLPSGEEMGTVIDRVMTPKMASLKLETDPKRKLAIIRTLKKEMRNAYNKTVKDSEDYRAHIEWARVLGLRTRVVDVRPTVQELYIFKERKLNNRLKRMMNARKKLRAKAYIKATIETDRLRIAYPEEFEGKWLREMGEVLGYPHCCVDAYAMDRRRNINVESRAASQLISAERFGGVDSLAYYIGYFFPCKPDCEAARSKGEMSLEALSNLDPSLRKHYSKLMIENMNNVRHQPEIISRYRVRAEGSSMALP